MRPPHRQTAYDPSAAPPLAAMIQTRHVSTAYSIVTTTCTCYKCWSCGLHSCPSGREEHHARTTSAAIRVQADTNTPSPWGGHTPAGRARAAAARPAWRHPWRPAAPASCRPARHQKASLSSRSDFMSRCAACSRVKCECTGEGQNGTCSSGRQPCGSLAAICGDRRLS